MYVVYVMSVKLYDLNDVDLSFSYQTLDSRNLIF